ncbi:acyl-CoA synthetase [Thioclava atlantica]|uniref:3-methylmercaptopropionyl-CoA ligase n=2 Tax=Thioclava atlantica TaxID=1317124 RepID=A0A085TZY8_9RHOB|nr:AMP-binding protein [Thioclava atlantica]KFE36285.1 acyl-CoA synthetase [Thioclava atlantica]
MDTDTKREAHHGVAPMRGLAHVAGATDTPLIEETIPQVLARTAAAWPEREAAIFAGEGIRWTWREFAGRVDRLAGGLLQLGLGHGDRLGIWAPNRSEWLLAQFATARIGVILVNINPAYRLHELEFALKKTGCRALVLAECFKSSDYVGMINRLIPELARSRPGQLECLKLPDLRDIVTLGEVSHPGCHRFADLEAMGETVSAQELDAITGTLDANEPINIQFTSGTTGAPKGATLTHRNIVNNAHFVTLAMRASEADRVCIPVPFYHCFGMVMGTLGCVTKGAAIVVPGEGFDPAATLACVAAERCTALYGVPTMFVAMLEHPDFASHDLSSLRTGIMAGAPCPIEVMKQVQSKMHMSEVTIAYGMTETSPVSFQSGTDTPLEKRVSSVGRIQPHLEVKIVREDGSIANVGEQGQLLTRGYSVMCGYWGEPERTAEAVNEEGWMHTGDLARIDAEGYCNITGRVKDMILRGGENIYPREIEEFLYTHPDVSQVQVFGIPDHRYGEIVAAWIVPRAGSTPTEESVKAFCRDQIAHFKVPAVIRFKDELPMTVTGKPQKFVMRDAMIEELQLAVEETA